MTSILNTRLCKLEKELECLLQTANKITNIQKVCFSEPETKSVFDGENNYKKPSSDDVRQKTNIRSRSVKNNLKPLLCKRKTSASFTANDLPRKTCPTLPSSSWCCPRNTKQRESYNRNSIRKVIPQISALQKFTQDVPIRSSSFDNQINPLFNAADTVSLQLEKEKRIKTEIEADQLQTEIDLLKIQLQELSDSKKEVLSLYKELEIKYQVLQNEKKEIMEKVEQLNCDNRNLCLKLEKEISTRKNYIQETQKTATKTKEAIELKLEEVQAEAAKSTKVMAENTEKFTKVLKEKEKCLKITCQKIEELSKIIEEKKGLILNIMGEKEKVEKCLEESKIWNNNLREVNEKLASTLKEYHGKILTGTNDVDCLNEEIKKYQEKSIDLQNQNFCLKQELELLYNKFCIEKTEKKKKEDQLTEYKEMQRNYQQKIQTLNFELQRAQESQKSNSKKSKFELKNLIEEHSKLKTECYEIQKKLKQFQTADEKRRKCIEEELYSFSCFVNEKETILIKEKEELTTLVDELSTIIKQHKLRVCELSKLNKKQEDALLNQSNILAEKEESLKKEIEKNKFLSSTKQQLEEEVKKSRKLIKDKQGKENEKLNCLESRLAEINNKYCQEQKYLATKENTIQNQNKVICELKSEVHSKTQEAKEALCKLDRLCEDFKRQNNEIKRLIQDLEKEKKGKTALIEELNEMDRKQKGLENKVVVLESTVEKYYNCTSQELKKKDDIIISLKKEMLKQKEEYDKEKKIIKQEKDKAIKAAKFATQKLYETVNDFQMQVKTQKQVQKFLSNLLNDSNSLQNEVIVNTNNYEGFQSILENEEVYSVNSGTNEEVASSTSNSRCDISSTTCEHINEINEIFGLNSNRSGSKKPFKFD